MAMGYSSTHPSSTGIVVHTVFGQLRVDLLTLPERLVLQELHVEFSLERLFLSQPQVELRVVRSELLSQPQLELCVVFSVEREHPQDELRAEFSVERAHPQEDSRVECSEFSPHPHEFRLCERISEETLSRGVL